ncbi:3992_t:CDS:2, partial [Ambispora gerdemannii]
MPAAKRLHLENWQPYVASNDQTVDLPPLLIDVLNDNTLEPDQIDIPKIGQDPKHFGEYFHQRLLLVTKPMVPVLYIADATELNENTSKEAAEVICKYFLALNKDILTVVELKRLVRYADNSSPVAVAVAEEILGLLKQHGALFKNDPVSRFGFSDDPYLVVRKLQRGMYALPPEESRHQGRIEEGYEPRELMYLDVYVRLLDPNNSASTDVNAFKEVLRTDRQTSAPSQACSSPAASVLSLKWKFLDLGLIYRFKDTMDHTHYLPLCPSAQKALLTMYMSFDIPENVKNG